MTKFLLDELCEEGRRHSGSYLDFRRLDSMHELSLNDKTLLARSRLEEMKTEIVRAFPGERRCRNGRLFAVEHRARSAIRFSHTAAELARAQGLSQSADALREEISTRSR
jgi:hypothetical protein